MVSRPQFPLQRSLFRLLSISVIVATTAWTATAAERQVSIVEGGEARYVWTTVQDAVPGEPPEVAAETLTDPARQSDAAAENLQRGDLAEPGAARSPSDLPQPVGPQAVGPQPVGPEDAEDEDLPPPVAPPPAPANLMASQSSLGITLGSYSAAPNMIGDHFGGLLLLQTPGFSGFAGNTGTVALAGGDRRFKIAENVSPIPRDRLFFNYNHFENALTDISGVRRSLDRFTLGLEKTFLDGEGSVELRLPLLSGLNSFQREFGPGNAGDEIGNLAMAAKMVLYSNQYGLISGGLAMTFPTGDDFVSIPSSVGPQVRVKNDAVHLGPFLGYLVQPNECWFLQGFVQADFDLRGNDVYTGSGSGRVLEGRIQEQNLLFVDASIGRWIHRSCDPCSRLKGVAAIGELHYTTTMNDADRVQAITNPFNRMDILNAVGAVVFRFPSATFRVGAAAPLRDDEERLFDAEIIAQFNRFF